MHSFSLCKGFFNGTRSDTFACNYEALISRLQFLTGNIQIVYVYLSQAVFAICMVRRPA